jgi:hypothetical protein
MCVCVCICVIANSEILFAHYIPIPSLWVFLLGVTAENKNRLKISRQFDTVIVIYCI